MSIKITGSQSLYYNMNTFNTARSELYNKKALTENKYNVARDNDSVLAWQKTPKEKPETDVAGVVAKNNTSKDMAQPVSINPFDSNKIAFMTTSSFVSKNETSTVADKSSSSSSVACGASSNGSSDC